MNFNISDLDKVMMMQKAAKRTAGPPRRSFLRPFSVPDRNRLLTLLFGVLLLLGILLGTLLVGHCTPEIKSALEALLGGYAQQRRTQVFSNMAISAFGSLFLPLLALFFCGFCSIAQPIVLFVPFFKGLGYGFSAGMLYANYGGAAARYIAVLLLPAMFCGSLLLIAACRSSLLLSVRLFRTAMAIKESSGSARIKRYCVKYALFLLAALLIALLDASLSTRFSSFFAL